ESAGALREESFDEVLRNRLVEGDLVLATHWIGAVLFDHVWVAIDFDTAPRVFDDVDLRSSQAGLLRPLLAMRGGHPVTAAGWNAFNVLGDRQAGGRVSRRKTILADFIGRPRIASVQDRVVVLAPALQPERIGEVDGIGHVGITVQ